MNHDPMRPRKLLLHRKEISSLIGKVKQKGYTLIPLRLYFTRNHAKVEVGLARGKRQFDKREAIAERDAKREIARAVRRGEGAPRVARRRACPSAIRRATRRTGSVRTGASALPD